MRKKLKIFLICICIILIGINVNYAKIIDDSSLSIDSKISPQSDRNKSSSFSKTITTEKINSKSNNNTAKIESHTKTTTQSSKTETNTQTTTQSSKTETNTQTTIQGSKTESNTHNTIQGSKTEFNTQTTSINSKTKEIPKKLSQKDIISASKRVNSYVSKHKKLPNHVKINGEKYSLAEFLYLMSKTIQNKYGNKTSDITAKYSIKNPARPRGYSIKTVFSFYNCYHTALKIISYIKQYKIAPNYEYLKNYEGYCEYMPYQTIIYTFAKLLSYDNVNMTIKMNVKNTSKINKNIPTYSRPGTYKNVNSKHTGGSAKDFLNASKNCQVNNTSIKALAKEITKGLKTKFQKAKAIHDWVSSNIQYRYYYNTKQGAVKTMKKKSGNCVDQTHLVIALYRSSGLPARYMHGKCKFVNGRTTGHVWAQVLVGKTWHVSDTTYYEFNRLGLINSWNTNTYKFRGMHNKLPF